MKFKLDPSIKFRYGKVENVFSDIKVIVGSEEKIFNETFVTGVVSNSRLVKVKKEAVTFL